MLHIFGRLTGHTATSQLATIKSQVTGVYMIRKNTKKNETEMEVIRPQSIFSIFVDNLLKFR